MIMSTPLLLTNGTVCFPSPSSPRVLEGHAVLLDRGVIARIAPLGEFQGIAAERIDLSARVVLPGFINLHTHLYSTFARGLTGVAPSRGFAEVLEHLWWRLDRALTVDDCYYSALPVLLEAIRSGTTTIVDHHSSPRSIRGSLNAIAKAVDETGLRACLCHEVSDRDGEHAAREGIEENLSFLSASAGGSRPLLRGMFGLHASFTLSDHTLGKAVEGGRRAGAGFHIHVAESAVDQEKTRAQTGLSVVDRLSRIGVLGERTIAAHGVHLNDAEMEILASTGTMVVHNPQSNMNNAVGIADLERMNAHGVLVGLGTDAMTHDMRQELRAGIWAQRHKQQSPSAGFAELVRALWSVNPLAATRLWGAPVGELREGGAADIIAIEYDPATPLTDETLLGHLVFGLASARVDTTIVGGKVLMHGGRLLLDLDEHEVAAKAREAASKVWERFAAQ